MTGVETIGALTIMYFVVGILKFVYWVFKCLLTLTIVFLLCALLWFFPALVSADTPVIAPTISSV